MTAIIMRWIMNILKTDDIFSDGLVLQRDTVNPIRGCGAAGAAVRLELKRSGEEVYTAETVCNEDGRWCFELPARAGEKVPYEFVITSGDETVWINNAVFGDVYHIAGQSNMELPLYRTYDPFKGELVRPDDMYVRVFRVPLMPCFDKDVEEDIFVGGSWKSSNEDYTLEMSAAGYYFAKSLADKYDIPIGLVNTSFGGAPIEGMMPYRLTKDHPQCREFLEKATKPGYFENESRQSWQNEMDWCNEVEKKDDTGRLITEGGEPEKVYKTNIPVNINDIKGFEGFSGRLWFWRTFTVDDDADIEDAMLILGTLTDSDKAYINGEEVGHTDYMYPPRYYRIGHGILRKGFNRVAVCLNVKQANGGFTEGKRFCVKCGDRVYDLSGEWSFAEAVRMPKQKTVTFFPGLPLCIYGKMFSPAFSHNYKGLVIYQGESNAEHPETYKELFTAFAKFYRERTGRDIPIITTQLCNFAFVAKESWCLLRQAQLECCLELDNTAMAVTIDVGEYNDLHPINKAAVGERLALCAEKLIYENKDAKPARVVKTEQSGDTLMLTFSESVALKADEPKYFEVSFDGESFTRAKAVQCGEGVKLTLDSDKEVKALRYLWSDSPEAPELYTADGLPVSPFRYSEVRGK